MKKIPKTGLSLIVAGNITCHISGGAGDGAYSGEMTFFSPAAYAKFMIQNRDVALTNCQLS
jgi:hypothetical protein